MSLLLLALCLNKNMWPAVAAYFLCVVYQYSYFDSHSAVVNHVIYGVIFIPLVRFSTLKLSIAMLVYSAFHWIVAVDYLLFSDVDTFISNNYNIMQVLLSISLMYSGLKGAHNDGSNNYQYSGLDRPGMFNLWHIQTFTKTRKR